jgi:hypothetical protein
MYSENETKPEDETLHQDETGNDVHPRVDFPSEDRKEVDGAASVKRLTGMFLFIK